MTATAERQARIDKAHKTIDNITKRMDEMVAQGEWCGIKELLDDREALRLRLRRLIEIAELEEQLDTWVEEESKYREAVDTTPEKRNEIMEKIGYANVRIYKLKETIKNKKEQNY